MASRSAGKDSRRCLSAQDVDLGLVLARAAIGIGRITTRSSLKPVALPLTRKVRKHHLIRPSLTRRSTCIAAARFCATINIARATSSARAANDLSRFTEIRTGPKHITDIARRRRIVRQPVNSAVFADKPIGLSLAQVYELLIEGATMITVRAFINPDFAAEWLEVPVQILFPLREQRMRVIRGLTGNRAGTDSHSSDC